MKQAQTGWALQLIVRYVKAMALFNAAKRESLYFTKFSSRSASSLSFKARLSVFTSSNSF